ncbi:Uncharacterized protein NV38_0003560 [Leptospira kirschneri serovar Mozdok]|nr:Uncharacterized protein NV38_0003560 [Leptospira kirschneri serovar Mozdok]NDK04355.1 hypothetical protein [Leptospira kirschneri serovar Mozdok]
MRRFILKFIRQIHIRSYNETESVGTLTNLNLTVKLNRSTIEITGLNVFVNFQGSVQIFNLRNILLNRLKLLITIIKYLIF